MTKAILPGFVLLLGTAIAVPFCFSNQTYDPAFAPKWLFFCGTLAAFFVLTALRERRFGFQSIGAAGGGYWRLWAVWCVWQGVSLLWSEAKADGGFEWAKTALVGGFALLAAENMRRFPQLLFWTPRLATAALAAGALGGWLQYTEVALTQDTINGWAGAYPYLTFANPNLFASWLALAIPFGLFTALADRNALWRILAAAAIAGALSLVYAAVGRTALAGLAAGGLLSATAYQLSGTGWARGLLRSAWLKKYGWAAGFAICLLVSAVFVGFYPALFQKIANQPGGLPLREHSINQRLFLWDKTVALIQGKPLLGAGAGGWRHEIMAYGTDPFFVETAVLTFDRPHNDWLWVGAETGLGGMALYLLLLLAPMGWAVAVMASEADRSRRLFAACLLVGLAVYFTDSMFNFPRERVETQAYWALVLAALTALSKIKTNAEAPAPLATVGVWPGRVAAAVWLAALGLGCQYGVQRYQTEIALRKILTAYKIKNYDLMIYIADNNLSPWTPTAPNYMPMEWYRGLARDARNETVLANADFLAAYQRAPYNLNVVHNLASSYFKINQMPQAINYYQKALELYPQHPEVLFNLSAAYYQNGQLELAYETALKCDQSHKEVAKRLRFFEQELKKTKNRVTQRLRRL